MPQVAVQQAGRVGVACAKAGLGAREGESKGGRGGTGEGAELGVMVRAD